MNNNNTTYKDSPLGKIPCDWEVKLVSELGRLISGLHLNPDDYNQAGVGIPYFTGPTDYTNEITSITKWTTKKSAIANSGDILITVKGSGVGSLHLLELEKISIGRQIMAVRANEDSSNTFIHYSLYHLEYNFKELAKGNMIPGLTRSDILTSKILTPPLPEQKAIAHVLGLMDSAINTNNRLIAKKELQKKWLMQNLLTGRNRLEGFCIEWKEYRLGQITTNFSSRNKELIDAKVYSVTNTNGFVLQSEYFEGKVSGEDLSNYKIIKKHEFAYNPARINVGSLAYFEMEIGVISSLYVCFKTKGQILDYYLHQLLQIDHTKYRIETLGEGGVRVYLWYDLFAKIKIKLPPLEEQIAIVKVLQAADKEIQLLKSKTERLRDQKRGLMQVLLTGKKRLKIMPQ